MRTRMDDEQERLQEAAGAARRPRRTPFLIALTLAGALLGLGVWAHFARLGGPPAATVLPSAGDAAQADNQTPPDVAPVRRPLGGVTTTPPQETAQVSLPRPRLTGERTLEETLAARRSVRAFEDTPLTLAEVGQLAWAAQGVTDPLGARTAPSAGARYPLELLLVAARVQGLSPGLYRYRPDDHSLTALRQGARTGTLARAALSQEWVRDAPATFVIAATFARITERYGERGLRYAAHEAGHAAQNLHLQAVALDLGSVPVGAFEDEAVQQALGLPKAEVPLYLIPVGVAR